MQYNYKYNYSKYNYIAHHYCKIIFLNVSFEWTVWHNYNHEAIQHVEIGPFNQFFV